MLIKVKYQWIPCNSKQYHLILLNTMEYHVIACNTIDYHAIPLNTNEYQWILLNTKIPSKTMQYHWIPSNTIEYHHNPRCYIHLRWGFSFHHNLVINITFEFLENFEQSPKNHESTLTLNSHLHIHSWPSLPPVHNLTEVIVLIFILMVFSFRLSGNTQSNIAIYIQFNCHRRKDGHHHKRMVNHHLYSWMHLLKRSFLRSLSSISP